ncbi:hypothetical protein OROMI_014890 [Orobanche minor]
MHRVFSSGLWKEWWKPNRDILVKSLVGLNIGKIEKQIKVKSSRRSLTYVSRGIYRYITVAVAATIVLDDQIKAPVSPLSDRITERQNMVVITDRMWARLLSSTNQPSFLEAQADDEAKDENSVVRQVKPDVLLGLSTVLEALKGSTSTRPAIFAMSNPTKNEEAFSIVGDNVIFGSGAHLAMLSSEGASEADLNILPKYKFQTSKDEHRVDLAAGAMVPNETSSGYMPSERTLSPDDAEDCDGIYGHVFGAFDCEVEALGFFCSAQ